MRTSMPVVLADGTVGWHQWTNHAIVDDRGHLLELQGVGRDITDQKRAQDALGQLEARNSAMLRAIPDLMFVVLRDGTYVDYHARDPQAAVRPARAVHRPHGARHHAGAAGRCPHGRDRTRQRVGRPGRRRVRPADGRAALLRGSTRPLRARTDPEHRPRRHGIEAGDGSEPQPGRTADQQPGGRACADRPRPARRRMPGDGEPDRRSRASCAGRATTRRVRASRSCCARSSSARPTSPKPSGSCRTACTRRC